MLHLRQCCDCDWNMSQILANPKKKEKVPWNLWLCAVTVAMLRLRLQLCHDCDKVATATETQCWIMTRIFQTLPQILKNLEKCILLPKSVASLWLCCNRDSNMSQILANPKKKEKVPWHLWLRCDCDCGYATTATATQCWMMTRIFQTTSQILIAAKCSKKKKVHLAMQQLWLIFESYVALWLLSRFRCNWWGLWCGLSPIQNGFHGGQWSFHISDGKQTLHW